jgi:hypothetical protein
MSGHDQSGTNPDPSGGELLKSISRRRYAGTSLADGGTIRIVERVTATR